MAVLDSLSPGAWVAAMIVRVALTVGLISIVGIGLAGCFRHHAAARHFVLLAAFVCMLATPGLAIAFLTQRLPPLVLTLSAHPASSSIASAREKQEISRPAPPDPVSVPARRSLNPPLNPHETVTADAAVMRPILPTSPIIREEQASPVVGSPAGGSSFRLAQAGATLTLLVWAVGSLFLTVQVVRGSLRLRALRRSLRFHDSGPLFDLLEEARHIVGGRRPPRIAESDGACTPIAAGILRPLIVLPTGLSAALGRDELLDVLVHEFAHLVRGDQIVIVLQAVARVAYWPIWPVHWLNRLLANAREEVCDNYVLARQRPERYGETLLRVAALSRNFVAFDTSSAMLGWSGRLEDRILELVSERRNRNMRVRPIVAACLAAVLVLVTGGLCGTRLASAQRDLRQPDEPAVGFTQGDRFIRDAGGHDADRRAVKVEVIDPGHLRAASTGAEKAVAKLMLVFFDDRARRGISGIVVDAGDHSFVLTTSMATRVPDELPPALEAIYLERAGKSPIEATYDTRSTDEIYVLRVPGRHSSYQLAETATVAAGDALDAAVSHRVGQIEIRPHAANVRAVNQEMSVVLKDSSVRHYTSLIEIDGGGFPEGTPFFKDGKLVGITLVGTRYSKLSPNLSYLVPAERMAALYRIIKRQESQTVSPEFPHAVPFELGETKFLKDDEITILEVRGTAKTFAPGNIYWVKGTYSLASHDKAELQASVSTNNGPPMGSYFKSQTIVVNQGTGGFTLFLPMTDAGFPHLSFNPVGGGNGFGGIYFGTGKSVRRQGGERSADHNSDHGAEIPLTERIWDALGVRAKELDPQDPRLTTLRHRGGLQVTEIRPESPASQGGLRKDDILFGLDRYATLKLADVVRILDHPRVDGPTLLLQFHVLRESKQVDGELKLETH